MKKIIILVFLIGAAMFIIFPKNENDPEDAPEYSIDKTPNIENINTAPQNNTGTSKDEDEVIKPKTSDDEIFKESFDEEFAIKEAAYPEDSRDRNWWVSSGAYFFSKNGMGMTIKGNLDPSDERFKAYERSNPRDTNGGSRPQNIFRLVLKKEFLDGIEEMYSRLTYYDTSDSEFRNASNGILFFIRYQDEDNLYYAGIRVDGQAVIKKKYKGEYTTLGLKKIFGGFKKFNKESNPNLLPLNEWIGIRSSVKNLDDGTVQVDLYVDKDGTGNWNLVLSTVDDGKTYGKAITEPGEGGVRTDFMDVEFRDYSLKSL